MSKQDLLSVDASPSAGLFLILTEVVCGDGAEWQPLHFFCTLTGRIKWQMESFLYICMSSQRFVIFFCFVFINPSTALSRI